MAKPHAFFTKPFAGLLAAAILGGFFGIQTIGGGPIEGVLVTLVLLVPLFVARWVFVDAKRNDKNAWGWAIGVFAFNVLGLAVYLGARRLGDASK